MGSRYGGLKQIEPVGPSGETMLDYSVYDALRAGFTRVVFVIRRDFEALFRERVASKYAKAVEVECVFQSIDELPLGFTGPTGREKPWGTGHATWCARDAVREPFAVINADDFYGAGSFRALSHFLQSAKGDRAGMVGFQLARTLSESGAVSRGICQVATNGTLLTVSERSGIVATDVGPDRELPGQTVVSMNCWGFLPSFLPKLEVEFQTFLEAALSQNPMKAEFYLPSAVSALIARGELTVDVLPTDAEWFGVTYKEDKPSVVASIEALVKSGAYPRSLWA